MIGIRGDDGSRLADHVAAGWVDLELDVVVRFPPDIVAVGVAQENSTEMLDPTGSHAEPIPPSEPEVPRSRSSALLSRMAPLSEHFDGLVAGTRTPPLQRVDVDLRY